MSDHDRRKKDGEDKNKDNQQMRAAFGLTGEHRRGEVDTPDNDFKDAQARAEEFDRDLRPHEFEGNNFGLDGPHPEKDGAARIAATIKSLHEQFQDLDTDDLKQLPILPAGTRLEQGATYLDLNNRSAGEFTARADMVVESGQLVVPKTEVDYQLWNRLRGVEEPERVGTAAS